MTRRALTLTAALVLGGPSSLAAQLTAGAALERYTFAEPALVGVAAVELRATPIHLSLPLGTMARVEGTGAFASGSVTSPAGERTELDGLSDLELGLAVSLARDRFVVRGTVAPLSATLTLAESQVAGMVASDLLPFSVSSWNAGSSVGGDMGMTVPVGPLNLAVLIGMRVPGEQRLLEDDSAVYRPGVQRRARAAISSRIGRAGALSVVGAFQSFSQDARAGVDIYQPGRRVDVLASYAFPLGLEGSALLFVGARDRVAGELLVDTGRFQEIAGSPAHSMLRAGFRLRLSRDRMSFLPEGELRIARSADVICYQSSLAAAYDLTCPAEQGWLASAGAAVDLRVAGRSFGRAVWLTPRARLHVGQLAAVEGWTSDNAGIIQTPREGARSGLTGWELGVGLRLVGGP